MTDLFQPLRFKHGKTMKNRFMLAPMTNTQSHDDGTLSEEEFHWLVRRAAGGFGMTTSCAAHVQETGRGFPGQLGIFSDKHLPGLERLARAIKRSDSLAVVQLHHAGMRAPRELIHHQQPLCPSDDEATGARALTLHEVERLSEDFILAALRAEQAGFDGVELHAAHGYLIGQFLSPQINRRGDRYGGALENRCRFLFDMVAAIRARCAHDFCLGVRLSPEGWGMKLTEAREIAQILMRRGQIDWVDLSLWDVRKTASEPGFENHSLLSYLTAVSRGSVRVGAAGLIRSGMDALYCLDHGLDYVTIGKGAILHHDFPERIRANAAFTAMPTPVTAAQLRREGLSDRFIEYIATNLKGFVAAEAAPA